MSLSALIYFYARRLRSHPVHLPGDPHAALLVTAHEDDPAGIRDPAPAEIHDYPQTMAVPLDQVVKALAKQTLLFQPDGRLLPDTRYQAMLDA